MRWGVFVLLVASPLNGWDEYNKPVRYEAPVAHFKQDYAEGAWKGEYIKQPNFANVLGNLSVNFTPAAIVADFRDLTANIQQMVESGFRDHKTDVALAVGGFVPLAGEGKKAVQAFQAGKEFRLLQKTSRLAFAPAQESGLTRKLQASVMASLKEGEIIAIRPRAYGANFLDGKLPAKPAGVFEKMRFNNGVRVLADDRRVISDMDVAFVSRNTRHLSESMTDKLSERINKTYGHRVITHGSNVHGVKAGIPKALEVEQKNERIYIFTRNGFLDSGPYQDMARKYLRGGR